MNSKHLIIASLMTMALASTVPVYAPERTVEYRATAAEGSTSHEAQQMVRRLEEIKAMDTRKLSKRERRALRKEVAEIDKKAQHGDGYVTISVGALIIIILLIMLL